MYGTGEEEHMAIVQSLDQLSKLLHRLDDLPLSVKSVQGVSPVFRFAEVGWQDIISPIKDRLCEVLPDLGDFQS